MIKDCWNLSLGERRFEVEGVSNGFTGPDFIQLSQRMVGISGGARKTFGMHGHGVEGGHVKLTLVADDS